ncbi:hypothetical protein GCM10022240_29020 [Microbacterium kribbense]|uniref:Flp pilus-assembly TadG-like N-terminal domain-containing protein n=1 Tax=Microbacterium kribbense TaxID=433645 RepID=A0ABP7GUC4_9MICO
MLVISQAHKRVRRDDEGAVLVAVVIVMFVGFIVVGLIASSLVFTIGFNRANRDNLQAFTAAESGRDAALATLHSAAGCSAAATTVSNSGSDPDYTATIYATDSPTRPTTSAGLTASCPTSSSTFVVITSTGTAAGEAAATIDAVYPWQVSYQNTAGGVLTYFSNGVSSMASNYTGDLVVRSGDYTCPNNATINGDLYVTNGNATFSSGCTVDGNLYVSGNVTLSSQTITVTGSIKAGGNVVAASNGVAIGGSAEAAGVGISAGGSVSLSNTGSTLGTVTGSITAAGSITVASQWTAPGTRSPNTAFPPFDPTLDWIYDVTGWIDLDAASGWNPQVTVNPCGLTGAQMTALLGAATTSLMLDFTQCSSNQTNITLNAAAVTRDVVFLAPKASRMNVTLAGALTGAHQLFFVHADASRDLVDGRTQPDCGNGNQKDTFDISTSGQIEPSVLLYTPCGLTGTVQLNFHGQLYTNQGGLTFGNGASYTCESMAWAPALPKLGCRIRGGSDPILVTTLVQQLGGRLWQSER